MQTLKNRIQLVKRFNPYTLLIASTQVEAQGLDIG
jgi:hypothetical protein